MNHLRVYFFQNMLFFSVFMNGISFHIRYLLILLFMNQNKLMVECNKDRKFLLLKGTTYEKSKCNIRTFI